MKIPTSYRMHSVNPVSTFSVYEAFFEKVGDFRRNLYKFGDIFGDSLETDSWFMDHESGLRIKDSAETKTEVRSGRDF